MKNNLIALLVAVVFVGIVLIICRPDSYVELMKIKYPALYLLD